VLIAVQKVKGNKLQNNRTSYAATATTVPTLQY